MTSNATSLYLDQEDLTRRLLSLSSRTGYDIVQKHGQRIYGGPPPNWTGPQPDKGTEVYCYRIPRDCFEDELVPVFSSVGNIYELRLMIEFSGTNRSYCYVRYTTEEEAREAINRLNNYHVRPGHPLAVTRSVDNRKLDIKTIPPLGDVTEEDVILELSGMVEGVDKIKFKARGWIEVEFSSHRLAALARRQLVPGNLVMFDRVIMKQVDWADPEVGRSNLQESLAKVISVRNLPVDTPEHVVKNMFDRLGDGLVTQVVKSGPLILVTFLTQEGAMLAMERSMDREVMGVRLETSWWSPRRLDRGSYSSMPRQQSLQHNSAMTGHLGKLDTSMSSRDMMDVVAHRNMMASYLARQVYNPPPGYSFSQGLYSHRHLNTQDSQFPPPSTLYPTPPPSIGYNMRYSPNSPQYLPSTSSLFTTTSSNSTKPILAVPPVFRGGAGYDFQYQ